MSQTQVETPTDTKPRHKNEAVTFGKKWAATIAYVILFVTQAWVTNRLFEQNARIEQIVAENEQQNCLTRQESRGTLRNVLFGLMDHFPDTEDISELRLYVELEYPPIQCPE